MKKLLKKYSQKTLANQVQLIFILITLFVFILLSVGFSFILSSQNNFAQGYNKHVLPLKNLNEIQNIFQINILDTIKEMEEKYIDESNAKEVLILANKLLSEEWEEYKKSDKNHLLLDEHNFYKKDQSFKTFKHTLNNLIFALDNKKYTEAKKIIKEQLQPQIISISDNIDDLIKDEMKEMEQIISSLNSNFNHILYFALPFILIFAFLFIKYIKLILSNISKTNDELNESKKEIIKANSLLEEKIEQRTKELVLERNKAQEATKAKSYFLANMSHEIRTPMNGILGMAHLVLKTDLSGKQKNYIKKIQGSANTLLSIINDILDISKIEAGKLQIENAYFDLFKVIENVINLIELKAYEKNLDVVVDYYPEIGKEFYGDSLRINQILTNLLSNAVKFTQKGEIGLVVKKGKNEKIRFEVSDTGIGLSKEHIEKIFDSFTQADLTTTKEYGGTGLGLSITKQLVELMNGKIWVESELEIGSKFIFEIEIQKYDKKIPFTMFNGKKVLIVDDSESWLSILDHLMHSFGLDVTLAHSGKEAINILKKHQHDYDLVLIDWNMPELDGIQTCKIIEEKLHIDTKKIILISAYSVEALSDAIKEAHIDKYLHKPVNPSILNDMLCEIFLGKYNTKKIIKMQDKNNLQYEIKLLSGNRILVVEDNETNKEVIIDLLENSGINIDVATNGLEAIEMFEKNSYELILMDIQMPILDGYEATKRIRETDKDIPIIALTANAMKEDVEKTKNAGMNEHLNKPIEVEKLYETLLKFLSKKEESTQQTFNIPCEEDTLPEFKTFDKKYGLKLVLGIQSAYIKILEGIAKYKDSNFEDMNNEDLKRAMHSLKGLTGSLGALQISRLAKDIEETLDRKLLIIFKEKLHEVIEEIEEKVLNENNKVQLKKELISQEKRDDLFSKLKGALSTNRAKNVNPIMKEIDSYTLSKEDTEQINKIKEYTKKFKFKQAMELL